MAEALWRASAVELAAGIRAKRFSCVEVMTSVVERIRALNPTLNAIIMDLTGQALAEARAADRALARGAEPGLLFGVPVTMHKAPYGWTLSTSTLSSGASPLRGGGIRAAFDP